MGRQLPDPLLMPTLRFLLLLTAALCLAGCGEWVGLSGGDDFDTGLEKVELFLTDEEMGTLADSVSLDIWANCRYSLEEGSGSGEVRIRGFTSKMGPKKSYTLKKDPDDGDHSKEALDAGGDPWISYNLAMYAYLLVGLPAPQLSPVSLYLDGEYMGYYNRLPLYTDSVDDFYNEDGQLFKIRVFDMGDEIPAESMSEKKYPDDDDYSALNTLLVNARHMASSDWVDWIEEHVDLEVMASYMVVRDYLGMEDTAETNFFIYYGDKYRILPWDNDHYWLYEDIGGNNVVTERMLESELFQEEYRTQFNKYFLQDTGYNIITTLKDRAEQLYLQLEGSVDYEPFDYLIRDDYVTEYKDVMEFLETRDEDILSDPDWADFFS